ncbi:MAG TPA: diguanylate cyclase, partial [Burkholderiaceae bacterium]|nr:diguanylate cyclase [Burkholderiaceae bacterium]
MPPLSGADPPALTVLTAPTAAAILLFAAGMAVLFAHALHKARSHDWVVALGWALGGSIASATALWALTLLGWLTFGGESGSVRAEPLAAAWGVAFGGSLLAVLASRVLPSHRSANPLVVALMLPTWVVVFVVLGSALQRPPNWQALAAGPTLAALAAAGIGLALGLQTVHGPRRRWARRAIGQRLAGVAVIAVGVLVAQAIALRSVPPLAASVASGELLDERLVRFALAFGAFCVVMALLCATVDSRSGRRAHALAGSLQLANRRLRELAFRDALTGLPNRLHFEERLDETLDAVGRQYAAMAVLFIDLDGFKAVNESFGHGAGDDVLREVGRRLHGVARTQDTAARIGGDEFLLLVAAPGSHEAVAQVAQQALHALMAPYHLPNLAGGGTEVRLSCSIGIAIFPEHGPTSRLIGNADAAMLAVKRTGGSTYAFYDARMDQDSGEALELQTDLRQAIERGELALFYQPKIDARTR